MSRTTHVALADARHLPLPDASVAAVVTDSPYGLEFMGRAWDGFRGEAWRAGAGFNQPGIGARPTPWVQFGAGRDAANPTCATCGHRLRGANRCDCEQPDWRVKGQPASERDQARAAMLAYQAWCTEWAAEALRVLRPGGWLLCFGGTRTWHRLTCGIEDAGFELRDQVADFAYGPLAWLYGQGYPKSKASLKPGWEPIVVARRPGRSVLQIDAARLPTATNDSISTKNPHTQGGFGHAGASIYGGPGRGAPTYDPTAGRWPPNVVLDETAAVLLDQLTGDLPVAGGFPAARHADKHRTTYRAFRGDVTDRAGHVDLDTRPSRFFYTAKADSGERVTLDGEGHPTVKPLELMRWLVRLVARPGDLVLDPFCGSGSTGEACMLEGMRAVLFDNDPASVVKAIARTDPLVRRTALVTVDGQVADADPRLF